jgi:hypothetical protein
MESMHLTTMFPACSCSCQDLPPRDASSDESGDEETPKARTTAGDNTPPRSRPSDSLLSTDPRTKEELLQAARASAREPKRRAYRTEERYNKFCDMFKFVCKEQLPSFDQKR